MRTIHELTDEPTSVASSRILSFRSSLRRSAILLVVTRRGSRGGLFGAGRYEPGETNFVTLEMQAQGRAILEIEFLNDLIQGVEKVLLESRPQSRAEWSGNGQGLRSSQLPEGYEIVSNLLDQF